MLIPQTYPLYIATLNDYLGVIESGRIIAWEQTDAPEAVLVPIFIWFGPEESTKATVRARPGLVQFVGDSLEDVERRAKRRAIAKAPDEVTATEGPDIDIDDNQPDDVIDGITAASADHVIDEDLEEAASEPPVGNAAEDMDVRTVEGDQSSDRPYDDLK